MAAPTPPSSWTVHVAVGSPCRKICRVEDDVCVGCGRTVVEIGNWMFLNNRQKAAIVTAAQGRLAAIAGSQPDSRQPDARQPDPRRGMTLVELLVVVAIIGVLVALLLPAVQMVREAARKASCKNNLRQVGIALHAYHDAFSRLPTGCLEWNRRQYAWSAFLLPFLEQQNLYRQIDFSKNYDAEVNADAARTRLQVYECPTGPERNMQRARTDYGGLYGERMIDFPPDDGLFIHEISFAFHHVRDGLTQTMAVAEDVGGPDSEWINGRNVFVQSGGINDPKAWAGDNEIRSLHPAGAMTLFADARVVFLSDSLDKLVLGQMITRGKGEVIEWP